MFTDERGNYCRAGISAQRYAVLMHAVYGQQVVQHSLTIRSFFNLVLSHLITRTDRIFADESSIYFLFWCHGGQAFYVRHVGINRAWISITARARAHRRVSVCKSFPGAWTGDRVWCAVDWPGSEHTRVLSGDYNCDSTTICSCLTPIRLQFDRATTIRRPTLQSFAYLLHCGLNK